MSIALLKKPRQLESARRARHGVAEKLAMAQAELDRAANAYVELGTRYALSETDGGRREGGAGLDAARKRRDVAADRLALMHAAIAEADRRVATAERADAETALAEMWDEARKLSLARNAAFDKVEALLGELEAASRDLIAVTNELADASPRMSSMTSSDRQEQRVTQAHRMHRFLDLFTRAFRLEDEFDKNFDFTAAKAGIREVERDWSRVAGTRDAEPRQFSRTAF